MSEASSRSSDQPVSVDAGTRLNVTYSFHPSACPVSDKVLVVHHGILHTREHFLTFIAELNALGFHVAMIDQQSEKAFLGNWIGLGSYATGMATACRQIEQQQKRSIGGFIYHSMGAAIGEKMQGRDENQALRLPTVFIAPIPVLGAWPIFTRLLSARTGDLLWAIVMRSVLSLAQTEEDVRQLFFDKEALPELVQHCQENLKHSPFYAYLQLTFRFIRIFAIQHNEQKNMLVTSDSDYIFKPDEYPRTMKLYRAGEKHPAGGKWLTTAKMPGGHDLFMAHPHETAELIATFFHNVWDLSASPSGPTRIDRPHDGALRPSDQAKKTETAARPLSGNSESQTRDAFQAEESIREVCHGWPTLVLTQAYVAFKIAAYLPARGCPVRLAGRGSFPCLAPGKSSSQDGAVPIGNLISMRNGRGLPLRSAIERIQRSMSTFWQSKQQKKRSHRASRLAGPYLHYGQQLECRHMLSGESMVENSAPEVGTPLYDVVVNSDAMPRLLDLTKVFVDADLNDEVSISIASNSEPGIVTPMLQGEQLLLEFTGVVGSSTITLLGTDLQGESVSTSFQVIVYDGASSISATVSDVSSIKPVGTVQSELSPPVILNDWESAVLEVWVTVGNDTPTDPFDFGIRFQGLASHFEAPTAHATLGSQVSLQHNSIDQWHSTYALISDLDLSAYQLGDKVLIASFVYDVATDSTSSVPSHQSGEFPALSHEALFQVTEADFVGVKPGVYQPYVASKIAPVVFDANSDGRIGIADFAQFITRYGKSSNPNSANHDANASWYDFNRDGKVGLADFALFIGNYGKQRGSSSEFNMPGLTTPLDPLDGVDALPSVEIPVTGVVDQVFDDRNQILYVLTNAGNLERWSHDGQTLLSRFEGIATTPSGFDITPDGRFAYVGDAFVENSQGTVWKVDLSDGSKTPLVYNLASSERGVFDLAIASNGKAFFTTSFSGSGWTPLHEIDLATGVITSLSNVRQNTGITRGADRSLLFFQESNTTAGPIFTYDAETGTFSAKTNTDRFVGSLPAAVGPRGDAVVFINVLLNDGLQGDIVGREVGYAPTFDKAGRFVYSIDVATNEVVVHDARNLQVLCRIAIGADVASDVNVAISNDSQHLFISTPSGIRQVATASPGTNPDDLQVPTGVAIRLFPDIAEITPPWLTIHFDEPVTGVTLDDLKLTRDGGSNLLDGGQSLFTIDGGRTWILFGAQLLMAPAGTYTLQVEAAGSGIQDLNGNLMASDFYQVWTRLLADTDVSLVQLEGVRDQVYDETQGILYITTVNGSLQRWDVARHKILSSINNVAVSPKGLDITPDGKYAYVGEGAVSIHQGVVWKVDLNTGAKTPIRYTYQSGERGVFDLAISADGKAFFTTDFSGSGWNPLRSIELATGALTSYRNVRQSTSITRGADRSLLFFQESNSSAGPIFTYDAGSQIFSDSLNSDRFVGSLPDAVSRDGSQIAFLSSILDSSDLSTTTIGISNAAAYAFDPTRDILYVADHATDEIVAYDPESLLVIRRFPIGEDITGTVGLTISDDASLVFLASESGLREIPLEIPEGDVVPPVGAFSEVLPLPRHYALDSLTVHFSKVVVGVTLDDFQLTRDGGANLLTGSETVSTNDGGFTWVVSGLTSLTRGFGDYQMELIAAGSGIQDSVGNLLSGNVSVDWVMTSPLAGSSLLPFDNVRDLIFDQAEGILYVTTSDGELHRWDVASQTLLESFGNISNNPRGLDVTPDGRFAYIGEGTPGPSGGIVWKVDLSDGSKTALVYDLAFHEQGVFDLVIASNGKAFFTTSFSGSGWTPLHEIDLATDVIRSLSNVRQDTGIARGADRSLLFFQESNISSGPIFTYDANTDTFSTKTNTNAFIGSLPAAVSNDGSQIIFRGSIWDSSDLTAASGGLLNASAYAFDPLRNIVYVADYSRDEIVAYDPVTHWRISREVIGEDISGLVEMSVNEDGSMLFIQTDQGVRLVEFFIPPGDVVPPYAKFVTVLPAERFNEVSSVTLQFDEIASGVSIDDFRLTRNGGANLLTGAETVTTMDGGMTWVIEGLADLTGQLGSYQLQLVGAGSQIQDQAGNLTQWSFATSWKVISPDVAGELLPFKDAVDHVFDETGDILYVTTLDGKLQRWDVATQTLLTSFDNIAEDPSGLDVTPDGLFAYIGEGKAAPGEGTVWKVDLSDGSKTALIYQLSFYEQGVIDLAIASNGKAYFTTDFAGSGSTPLHELDLATGEIINLRTVTQNTGIARSADRSRLFFQEGNISSGPIFTFDANTGTFSNTINTNGYNGTRPAAVSHDGSLIAFRGVIRDASDLSIISSGFYNAAAYAFDPLRDILYVADYATDEIVAYDPITLWPIDRQPIGENIPSLVQMSVNEDGSILFVQTDDGMRQVTFSIPAGDVIPPSATFAGVFPPERYDEVDSAVVQFDEIVAGVTIDDFRLTRNGGGNLLTGAETVSTSDGGTTWVIDGLAGLTGQLGSYQLQLVGAGSQIQDQTGNLMQWDFSMSWKVISRDVAGELLPFADVVDHAFDETSGILYVTTTDGSLHCWDTTTRTLLDSFEGIATTPKGLDISIDGMFAYVGDRVPTEDGVTVWQVDLQTGTKTPFSFDLRISEAGVWDLTVTSTGKLFFTSLVTSNNYGYRRVVDLATGEATFLTSPRHVFRMSRSADGTVVFFAEAGLHDSDVVVYHTDTDTYSSPINYQLLIGNDPSAVSPDGSQVVFVGKLFDSTDLSTGQTIFGQNIGGYIFHPTQDILYAVDMSTHEIVAYDLVSQTTRGRFAIGESFPYVNDISVSAEGSIVYISTPSGIRAVHADVSEMASPARLVLEGESNRIDGPQASSETQSLAEWFPLAATAVDTADQGKELEEETFFVGPPAPLSPEVTEQDWQHPLNDLDGMLSPTDVDDGQYTCAVDDLFDQLEESELELLLD